MHDEINKKCGRKGNSTCSFRQDVDKVIHNVALGILVLLNSECGASKLSERLQIVYHLVLSPASRIRATKDLLKT